MTQRSSSVVVIAQDWEGSLDELARQMMPVTRRRPDQVVPLLERGPMTIEADLGFEEAERLRARLQTLGVPARIVGDGEAGDIELSAPPNPPAEKVRAPTDPDPPISTSDEPEEKDSGWEQIFSGLKTDDELVDDPLIDDPLTPDAAIDDPFGAPGDFGAIPAPVQAKPKAPADPPPPAPPQPKSPGWDSLRAPSIETQPAAQKALASPVDFDTSRMTDALRAEDADRPPYAPEGFDDRVEHVPALAAALSLLAPGAGQIYNGEPERVRELCLHVVLVRPWWRSVRQAHEFAEKIRTNWAPRPPAGALGRALKHLAICWAVGLVALALLSWSGTKIYELAMVPDAPTITSVVRRGAVESAQKRAVAARAQGIEAAATSAEKLQEPQRFTMSKQERAERLFLRGYHYCKRQKYTTCASAMKRVSALSPELRRKAFRLQAWAGIRKSGEKDVPMPDIGPVETLAEYELNAYDPAALEQPDAVEPPAVLEPAKQPSPP